MIFDILVLALLLMIVLAVLFPDAMRAIVGGTVFLIAGLIGLFYFENAAADFIRRKGYTMQGACVSWSGKVEPEPR
jgi:hypothetical protein